MIRHYYSCPVQKGSKKHLNNAGNAINKKFFYSFLLIALNL